MNHKKLKLIAALLLSIGLSQILAQEIVLTAGGNIAGSGGSVSYSVGQIFYTNNAGLDGSVIQGVQQPYEIFIITDVSKIPGINLFISTYPNPTNNFIQLLVENENLGNFNYELYDINGNLLENEVIASKETHISMHERATATYLLRIIQGNKEVKTFKIIKN